MFCSAIFALILDEQLPSYKHQQGARQDWQTYCQLAGDHFFFVFTVAFLTTMRSILTPFLFLYQVGETNMKVKKAKKALLVLCKKAGVPVKHNIQVGPNYNSNTLPYANSLLLLK